jgi:hypothetical protein
MITDGVYAYLSTHATIIAAVGTRIYGGCLPQDCAMPCILFTVVVVSPLSKLHGTAVLDRTLLQFDIYASDYEGARSLAATLRSVLEGFVGSMGSHTVRSITVVDPGSDGFENTTQDFRVIAEYEIWHTV